MLCLYGIREEGDNMRSNSVDRQTLRAFWLASLQYKTLMLRALFFPLGILLSSVIVPLFIGKTLGALAQPGGNPYLYWWIFVAAAAMALICNRLGHPVVLKHHSLVTKDLQENALTILLNRSVGFHNNNISGKIISDAIDYSAAYEKLHDVISTTLIPLTVTLFIGSTIIFFESWQLGLFITATTLLVVGAGVWDSFRIAPRRFVRLKASKDVTAHLADTITNIQTTKTFSGEQIELKEHRKLSNILNRIRINDWRLMSVRGNNRMILLAALQAGLIMTIIMQVRQNPALLGVGIFAFSFTVTLSNRLFEINMLLRVFEEALLQASPMTSIIAEEPEVQDNKDAKKLACSGGEVDFSSVTFSYDDANKSQNIFTDFNLKVAPGEKIGLVGPSGGGKTTLTRLLLRFEDINDGEIKIDGQNIANVTQKSLRSCISYVPQEPLLFHRTIRENIAYGKPSASFKDIQKAAQLAHADEFVSQLQDGYDTIVGERGVKLSGGQRQRIAIARAILKDAPILVLDEATSALDSESEVLIQQALWKLMENRTTIVIAHRLSTIQKMDRVCVLDDGKVAEQGTHKHLLAKGGLYAKLWSHQSGGFLED